MPAHAFNDTVLSARRWSGPESLANGIVCATHDGDSLWSETLKFAEQQTQFSDRRVMGSMKGRVKGQVARGLLEFCFYGPQSKGEPMSGPTELPAGLAKLRDSVAGERESPSSLAALFGNSRL